ncbi:unnamed protein product [Pieris brassicae]|uniref:Uncharacterized protein n=1 Tax=Pieris brassicae TaxID=7116 RepID=A0A9P0TRL0_PIEBR|nr:unnamed protein product [Pieris brassicae]
MVRSDGPSHEALITDNANTPLLFITNFRTLGYVDIFQEKTVYPREHNELVSSWRDVQKLLVGRWKLA